MLDRIVAVAPSLPWIDGIVLVGSMADGEADALSDIDLLVVVAEGCHDEAWRDRERLEATGAIYRFDQRLDPSRQIGVHRWLTDDLVLVEALIGTASSGVRLAEPWVQVHGDTAVPARLAHRDRIRRSELGQLEPHPVEAAYDEFRARIRAACAPEG